MSLSELLWAHAVVMLMQFLEMVGGEELIDESTRARILSNRMRTFIKVHYVAWLAALVSVIVLYESMGSLWVILALGIGTWAGLLTLTMIVSSVILRAYIPGMVSGIGFFVLRILLLRDHVGTLALGTTWFIFAILLGIAMAVWMMGAVAMLRQPGDGDSS